MLFIRYERLFAGLLIGLFSLHALIYSAGPIFEPPDERLHYAYMRYLTAERALPDPYANPGQEYHQPPLYYALAAPIAALIDAFDSDGYTAIAPQANTYYDQDRQITGNDNRNLYIHPRAENFPYTDHDDARTIHALRVLSVLLATGTVIAAYACFRLLWPDHTLRDAARRVLALGFVVFMPQFAYISGALNNDNLLLLLATLSLYLLLRQLRAGVDTQPTSRSAIVLGIVLGLALLTKLNAAFLAFPTGFVILIGLRRNRQWWRYGVITLVVVFVVAGWWYVRNWIEYGDPTGTQVYFDTWPNERIREGALALDVARDRLPRIYDTLWASFGHRAVIASDAIYTFYDGLTVIVVVGAFVSALRWGWHRTRRNAGIWQYAPTDAALITIYTLAWIAALIYSASVSWSVDQGRFLLPAMVGWGALVAFGLTGWIPRRVSGGVVLFVALALIVCFGVMASVILFDHFLPAYRPSPVPDDVALDTAYAYTTSDSGAVAELIGASPGTARVRPGDHITLTLVWRAIQPATSSLQTYLHTIDSAIVQRDSLPGTGNLLATDWESGEAWAEHYAVTIPDDAPEQTVFTLVGGLYDPDQNRVLDALDANGNPVTPVVGRIAINGPSQDDPPVTYRFGNSIRLDEPQITRAGDQIQVCMNWSSLRVVEVDYHIFVHVIDGDETVTQADVQPRGGTYPTGAWSPGDVIADCITFDAPNLPADGWHSALGLYNLDTFARLPVTDAHGESLGDAVIIKP